jgi:hypothetical protein
VPTTNNQIQKSNQLQQAAKQTHTHDRYKQQNNLNNSKLKQQQASRLPFFSTTTTCQHQSKQ